MRLLLRGGTVVTPRGLKDADVLIEDGIIRKVEKGIVDADAQVNEVNGKLLFPGFLDAHTHFDLEVAGTVTADNFRSGTKAAIIGGTTMIVDFATQNKGESLTKALENWHRKADYNSSCDYGFHMAISDWNQETKKELSTMIEKGVTSFKLYMTYDAMMVDDGELYEILKETRKLGGLVGVHCENMLLIKALVKDLKAAGKKGPSAHPLSRPACVEAEAVQRLLTIARLADSPVMVVHLTCRESLEQIRYARERGQQVFAETCPQYLLLEEGVYQRPGFEGAKYVCSPPLRTPKDQACLWEALSKGAIQTIATDHCSFTMTQKEMGKEDFTRIPNGMPGVEHRGVLLYSEGVLKGRITLEQMCGLLSENPAKLYGVYPQKGCIRPGSDADIVVWDTMASSVISCKNHHYNMDYSPFEGLRVTGQPEQVYLRGRLTVLHGKLTAEQGGIFIKRQKGLLDGREGEEDKRNETGH